MTYRDDSAARADVFATERDDALARVKKLEAELAEARAWLKAAKERAGQSGRPLVVAWAGYGGLGGCLVGAAVSLDYLAAVAAVLGALFGVIAALSGKKDDSFPAPPPPPAAFP